MTNWMSRTNEIQSGERKIASAAVVGDEDTRDAGETRRNQEGGVEGTEAGSSEVLTSKGRGFLDDVCFDIGFSSEKDSSELCILVSRSQSRSENQALQDCAHKLKEEKELSLLA